MSLEISYRDEPEYLLVQVDGKWDLDSAKTVIDDVRDEARKRGYSKVLLDLRNMLPPDTELTRFLTGEYVAQVWGGSIRVANFAKPELINHFAVNVALNRGAIVANFVEKEAALQWLLKESKTSSKSIRQITDVSDSSQSPVDQDNFINRQ